MPREMLGNPARAQVLYAEILSREPFNADAHSALGNPH